MRIPPSPRERGFTLLDDSEMTIVEVNYNYIISKQSRSQVIKDNHLMRAFSVDEVQAFLLNNGFQVREIYSSFKKNPFNENSNKIIVIFDKKEP